MKARSIVRAVLLLLCLIGASPGGAGAQTTTGRIQGYVRGPDGEELAGATVVARNTETNQLRRTATAQNGAYVLAGLRPGPYEITVNRVGAGTQTRALTLLVGQNLDVSFALASQALQLEAVSVNATGTVQETRTSEVATNITRQQVEALPTSDRNFLGLAVLAPGTQLQGTQLDATRRTFSAGAQGAEQVNVFIDGASYKNDILQGGVAGQDASRGNPFPRNAIGEFRVITQNFKAEYQKASSAIITATTRSGTNQWETNGFINYQDRELVALDSFQRVDRRNNPQFERPDFVRYQWGVDVGGPIIRDRLFFFGSVERNDQTRAARVNIIPPPGFAALDSINFAQYNGEFDQPFRSILGFAKLGWEHREGSFFELSFNTRHENDVRDFGGVTAFQAATRFRNDVNTGILKHTWTRGDLLNEATFSGQRYHYNRLPNDPGTINRLFGFGCCAQLGSDVSDQDFTQTRWSLRNDLTWTGFEAAGDHVVKGGFNVDFLDYDIVKRNSENPRFVYEPWFFGFAIPQRVEFQAGDPNFGATNTQVGLYLQDDWSPTERLVLNLGVRWDYESHMMNYDYVTPQAVVDSVSKYRDRLFIPLDEDRYFTDGDDRSPFYGAIQPRLGFSYALGREQNTAVFGGWGLFYDRTLFDHAIEESFALQHPSYRIEFSHPDSALVPGRARFEPEFLQGGPAVVQELIQNRAFNTPEVKLIPNDLRPPKAQHFNVGLRHDFGLWNASVAYTGVRSENQFTFYFANMNFTCQPRTFACFTTNNVPGFSTILLGDDRGKTWYDAIQLKVDRPYRSRGRGTFGWGAGLAVTVAERETEGFNDLFSFPNPADFPRQVRNDEKVRLVGHWVLDVPFAWGTQFSGLVNLGSGTRADAGDRYAGNFDPGGFSPVRRSFLVRDAFAFRTVDLRLRKDFLNVGGGRVGVTVDAFNVFNYQNYGCYNTGNPADTANFGKPGCVVSDPRRVQFGLEMNAVRR
jgi:hypothetical protein